MTKQELYNKLVNLVKTTGQGFPSILAKQKNIVHLFEDLIVEGKVVLVWENDFSDETYCLTKGYCIEKKLRNASSFEDLYFIRYYLDMEGKEHKTYVSNSMKTYNDWKKYNEKELLILKNLSATDDYKEEICKNNVIKFTQEELENIKNPKEYEENQTVEELIKRKRFLIVTYSEFSSMGFLNTEKDKNENDLNISILKKLQKLDGATKIKDLIDLKSSSSHIKNNKMAKQHTIKLTKQQLYNSLINLVKTTGQGFPSSLAEENNIAHIFKKLIADGKVVLVPKNNFTEESYCLTKGYCVEKGLRDATRFDKYLYFIRYYLDMPGMEHKNITYNSFFPYMDWKRDNEKDLLVLKNLPITKSGWIDLMQFIGFTQEELESIKETKSYKENQTVTELVKEKKYWIKICSDLLQMGIFNDNEYKNKTNLDIEILNKLKKIESAIKVKDLIDLKLSRTSLKDNNDPINGEPILVKDINPSLEAFVDNLSFTQEEINYIKGLAIYERNETVMNVFDYIHKSMNLGSRLISLYKELENEYNDSFEKYGKKSIDFVEYDEHTKKYEKTLRDYHRDVNLFNKLQKLRQNEKIQDTVI